MGIFLSMMLSEDIPIFVLYEPENRRLLNGFGYLFNRHWSKEQWISVVVSNGDNLRDLRLPDNFADYRVKKSNLYTDTLIALLKSLETEYLILFQENYWLRSRVDYDKLLYLTSWIKSLPVKILRLDLSGERSVCLSARAFKGQHPKGIDMVYTPPGSDGLLRFTPSIWNREKLLELLVPRETQIQSEQGGTAMMATHCPGAVLGVKLLDCIEVCNLGNKIHLNGFDVNIVDYMRHRGWLRRIEC